MLDRRLFLGAGSAVGLASCLSAQEKPALPIIDAHTHFYDPTRPEGVPWPGKGDSVLYRPILPAEFEKRGQPLGIVGTVVVEASSWLEDNQWLLDLAKKNRSLVGVVGRLDPLGDEFAKQVRRFAANEIFRGIRISHGDLKTGFAQGKIVAAGKVLLDHDLELDVNGGPEMPADVARLAEELPKLRIVINHCGNLRIDGREPPTAWRNGMQAAAKHPRVYCKVSALVEQTGRKEPPLDVDYYRPVLDHLWSTFGEDRLIFGSNWPVSARYATLEQVVAIVRDYFTARGKLAAEKYFLGNSQQAYRWTPR